MENWGLVTYRETALLIDPKNSSSKSKQWVALVVGHELAHQWFGNLVTMVSLSDWTVIGTNRHMKSNVSLLDDGHLVVLYYPLFLNIPEGIFFYWFRPFSKFLQKIHFCASKKKFTWRVLPPKTDYYLKTWLIVICSCSKNYSVNCTEFIPVFLGMVDSPVAQWGLCLMDWVPLCGLLLPRVWHLDTVRELWPRQSSGDGCFTQ